MSAFLSGQDTSGGPRFRAEGEELPKPVMPAEAAMAFVLGQIKGFSDELLQALPVAVYTTDAQGLITSFNEAAVKLWGCRPQIGKTEYCGSYPALLGKWHGPAHRSVSHGHDAAGKETHRRHGSHLRTA